MTFRHGTRYSYDKKGCRCDICRVTQNERQRRTYNKLMNEAHLRRHGITLTLVREDPVEWSRRVGIPFCGDAS